MLAVGSHKGTTMPTLRPRRSRDVHGRVALLHAAPELPTTAAYDVEANAAALAKAHQDQVAVRAALCVVAHLRCAVQGTLVCALAPPLPAIHRRVLNILIPTGVWCALGVELFADLGHRRDDMAGVRGGGAAQQEVVVLLTIAGL